MELGKLYAALSKAQGALTSAGKTGYNPHFKSGYADLHGIWETIRQPLVDNELCVLQTIEMEEGKYILVTTLGHSSGQAITSRLPLTPKDNTSQAYGSAITYGRRYSLMALLGISVSDDKEDDDGEAAEGRGKDKEKKKNAEPSPLVERPEEVKFYLSDAQIKTICELIGPDTEYMSKVLQGYKVKSLNEIHITSTGFINMLKKLKNDSDLRISQELDNKLTL